MAGLEKARSPVEREGVRRGTKIASEADGLLLLLDGSRSFGRESRRLIERYRDRKIILVINKTDLPSKVGAADLRKLYPGLPVVAISALKGTGIRPLREWLSRTFRPDQTDDDIVIFRKRDKLLLEEMTARLLRAKKIILDGGLIETVAEEAREIVSVIARMTGEIRTDEILDDIFSRFCIGK
jgi:tRNA modification GTPase